MLRLFIVLSKSAMVWVVLWTSASLAQQTPMPPMRWGDSERHKSWNAAADVALRSHGLMLSLTVPADISIWCPHYPQADLATRRQFWVGFLSALAKHESTYKPRAVGGGGKWFGLMQISPATARGYGCRARTGEALKSGEDNLSCAIRIMAVTVPRDGVVHDYDGRWRGVSADWGPMRSERKRADIARWLRNQPFCEMPPQETSIRPRLRNSLSDR